MTADALFVILGSVLGGGLIYVLYVAFKPIKEESK